MSETRQERIVRLRRENPCMTLAAIGEACDGLTRERVRQVLTHAGVETKHLKIVQMYECLECHRAFTRQRQHGSKSIMPFCSYACRKVATSLTLTCTQCGNTFQRRDYTEVDYARRRSDKNGIFCSKHCWGVYMGSHLSKYAAMKR